ncbi:hypothetical protein BH09ACT1_BH09ACT1_12790 [soil metagenome]
MVSESVSARMSPGPWWGYNGINTLEIRSGVLVHSFRVLFYGYLSRVYDLADVEVELRSSFERRGRRWISLRLRMQSNHQLFTGFPADSEPFINALIAAAKSSQAELG